jgi:arylsulfatase A-like enzyme
LNRRALLKTSTAALAPLVAAATPGPQPASRPNIVLIISDQFRWDNIGAMGLNPMRFTPHLDRMARRGTLFRSAISNQPVCAPARACIFTGQYPQSHGVWRNGIELPKDAVTLASVLRGAGYTANYVGKWHLAPVTENGPVAPEYRGGFLDLWEAANVLELISHPYEGALFDRDGKPLPFAGLYRESFITSRAVRFLQDPGDAPFLLVVSYLNAHHQNDVDRFMPPRGYEGRFRNPFVPPDLAPLPGSWPSQLGDYYACAANIDDEVGKLLTALQAGGRDRETIVAFVSDHGCHFKTRNTEYKRGPHESSIHVPLVMQGPGFDRSIEIQELVSHVDIAPSLLAAAGITAPAAMEGRSFLPLLDRKIEDWRNEAYVEMSEFVSGRVLRTPEYTYAVAAPKPAGWKAVRTSDVYSEYMVYDLAADPGQHVNLAGRAAIRGVAPQLRERLQQRIAVSGKQKTALNPAPFPYV